jgi:hypothetical protein
MVKTDAPLDFSSEQKEVVNMFGESLSGGPHESGLFCS